MTQQVSARVPPVAGARPALARAYARTGLDVGGLWLRYVALGGNADVMEVDGYLQGLLLLMRGEHNVLACAVNERLDELGDGHARVPYSWEERVR